MDGWFTHLSMCFEPCRRVYMCMQLVNRCRANAKDFYKSLCLVKENISQPCKGCNYHDVDNPRKEVSSHLKLKDSQRHTDMRVDWQGQPMYGLNPYDRYGRLQV